MVRRQDVTITSQVAEARDTDKALTGRPYLTHIIRAGAPLPAAVSSEEAAAGQSRTRTGRLSPAVEAEAAPLRTTTTNRTATTRTTRTGLTRTRLTSTHHRPALPGKPCVSARG